MPQFPFYHQLDQMDCGPTCLRMIAKFHGRNLNIQKLRNASGFNREGVSLLGIAEAAESVGFRTLAVKVPFEKLVKDAPLPCIIHWQQNHFVVLVEAKKGSVLLADPGKGIRKMSEADFCEHWVTPKLALSCPECGMFVEHSVLNKNQNDFQLLRTQHS